MGLAILEIDAHIERTKWISVFFQNYFELHTTPPPFLLSLSHMTVASFYVNIILIIYA